MESAEPTQARKAALGVLTAPGVLLVASWAVVLLVVVLIAALL